MDFTLGVAQTSFPEDGDVLRNIGRVVASAHERDVDLLAFPENLMCPRELSASELATLSEPLDGPYVRAVCNMARESGMWIVFTASESNPHGGPPFNTAVVANDVGEVQGTYRKCHLYDAHGVSESSRMAPGSRLCSPIRTPFCTLGVGICYDLRFPEHARALALEGCDMLVFPAAWHDGPNKPMHWKTLLRARAIENECYVAGICHGAERYVGHSHVFDPLGNKVASGSDELLVCRISPRRVCDARDAMPVFDHRRPELYRALGNK